MLHAFFARASGFFLTGGAVLVGWELGHRSTDDLDLFTNEDGAMETADVSVKGAAAAVGAQVKGLIASPDFRRFLVTRGAETVDVDVVRDRSVRLYAKVIRDGIEMDSAEEIFVNKICAIVGRSELRDIVDLRALEKRGLRVEDYLAQAQRKDGGVTSATLAWLLGSLEGGDAETRAFASELSERMLKFAVPK